MKKDTTIQYNNLTTNLATDVFSNFALEAADKDG